MARIYPFRAFRYNPEKVGSLETVATQPYDKITPEMQARYYGLSPYNLARIIKGRTEPSDTDRENVYTRAARYLEDWKRERVLVQEPDPAIYPYFQEYEVPGSGQKRVRKGFIAAGQIEDYDARVIFRHEQTLSAPKADRLELLRHTRTHFGQIFMLFSDPAREVDRLLERAAAQPPAMRVRDEYGTVHTVWRVADPADVAGIQQAMADKKLIIADGHHRYETALIYRNECRARLQTSDPTAPHERVMMTFINTEGEGLTILPTHRVVSGLKEFAFAAFRQAASRYFDWYAYPFSSEAERPAVVQQFHHDLVSRGEKRPTIGAYVAGERAAYLFLLKINADLEKWLPDLSPGQRTLDIVLLHRLLLQNCLNLSEASVQREQNLRYLREWEEAIGLVESGQAQVTFLLNPVRIEQVRDIALRGEVLPQKSTDFYPKLLSGLTAYSLDAP